MSLEFNSNGLTIQTYEEIYSELSDGYKSIYGNDINIDPDSPDGQRIGIEAQAILDLQTFALNLYNQMDVDLSSGEWQNRIIKLAGLARRAASRSQVDIDITVSIPVTLSSGYQVKDDLGQIWETDDAVALGVGTTSVTFFSRSFAAIEADPNTITTPVDIVIGITSFTNPLAALVGRDEETDEELRVRRNKSLLNPSYSTVGGLFARLANLSGVTDVIVYENDQDTYDATRDINPHTIWAVIEGGSIADITEVIVKNKTAGTGLKGSVSGTYEEEIIKADLTTFTLLHTIKFDRPAYVNLHVTVTATRIDSGVPIDTDLLAEKIAEATFTIGENVLASKLYSFGYNAGDTFILSDMMVSDDGVIFTDESVLSDYGNKYLLSSVNITVNEVI